MKISVIKEFLSRYTYFDESKALAEFFSDLPDELDLVSAKYYLLKEFSRQDTGYDEATFREVPSELDEGDSWYDSSLGDDEWEDDPVDEDATEWCDICRDYVNVEH